MSKNIPMIVVRMRRVLHPLLRLLLLLRIKHLLLLMIRLLIQTGLLLLHQVSLHCLLLLMDSIGAILLVWVKVWMGLLRMLLPHQIFRKLGGVF